MDRRLRLTKERKQAQKLAQKKMEAKAKADQKIDPQELKRQQEEEKEAAAMLQQKQMEDASEAEQLAAAAEAAEKAAAEQAEKEIAEMMAAAGLTSDDGPPDTRERDENGELVNPDEELVEEDLFEKKKRLAEEAKKKNRPDGFVAGLLYRLKKGANNLEAGLTSYGPPYQMDYGGNLPEECSKGGGSFMEVHSLLTEGADPHLPLLTEDEQSGRILLNTPLHYACKYCNLRVAKMLRRADRAPSIINQVNAMGTSPLQMTCMFSQAAPRKKAHYALVLWLLDQGAEPNHVDRAGQTALHFAAYR